MVVAAVLEVETRTEPSQPAIVEAARSLALHLREQPRDRVASPARLADQFGVSPGMVCSVLEGVRQAAQNRSQRKHTLRAQVAAGMKSVNDGLRDLTNDPMRFLLFSSLALAIAGLIPFLITHFGGNVAIAAGIALLIEFIAYITLHTVCVWRAGKARFAWLSAALTCFAIVFIGVAGRLPWHMVFNMRSAEEGTLILVGSLILGFFLAFLQGLVLTLVAFLGGYLRLWQIDRHTRSLTRQEAIQRLIELQSRLKFAQPESKARSGFRRVRTRFRQHAQSLCLGAGLAFGTAGLLFPKQAETLDSFGSVLAITIGLLAPGPATALLFGVAFGLAESILPWFRIHTFAAALDCAPAALVRGLTAWVVALVAFIYEMNSREKRLGRNEVNVLVEELIRVEWRLQEAANWVTALCIDAAGSTRMKMGADPLMVEYSFRAYQQWIARTCLEHNGVVQATAGDGAIVSFGDAAHALSAAKRLQRDLDQFNTHENRIGVPFRVRIGIHRGQVRGALHEIEFTNVIDIAAHIEKISPVGGIAISEAAFSESRQTRPDERALALAEPVDGQTVYVVLNATEEA
jgi:class 3 adenylate cyclase